MIKLKLDDPIDATIKLKARKLLTGDILILDHPELDIVVSTNDNRVVSFPKKEYGDYVYAIQSRLFDFLVRKGAILNGSVRASNVFGSIQGFLLADAINQSSVDPTQIAIYLISKFIKEELEESDIVDDYQDAYDDELTEPSEEETTRLGKIPHEPHKGTSYFGKNSVYGIYGTYEE